MNNNVRVKFPMTQHAWNDVVVNKTVDHVDVVENSTDFVVTYNSMEEFENERSNWEGMIEYEILKDQ